MKGVCHDTHMYDGGAAIYPAQQPRSDLSVLFSSHSGSQAKHGEHQLPPTKR